MVVLCLVTSSGALSLSSFVACEESPRHQHRKPTPACWCSCCRSPRNLKRRDYCCCCKARPEFRFSSQRTTPSVKKVNARCSNNCVTVVLAVVVVVAMWPSHNNNQLHHFDMQPRQLRGISFSLLPEFGKSISIYFQYDFMEGPILTAGNAITGDHC